MTLGELIDQLQNLPMGRPVRIMPVRGRDDALPSAPVAPAGFVSYRGIYGHLALTPASASDPSSPRLEAVADLYEAAKAANGAILEGWKGGEYRMDRDTPIWLAEEGRSSGIALLYLVPSSDYAELVGADITEYAF